MPPRWICNSTVDLEKLLILQIFEIRSVEKSDVSVAEENLFFKVKLTFWNS